MRYRIGDSLEEQAVSLDRAAFTSITLLSLLIGIGFVVTGLRSRHYWMTIWGSGLAICSAGYLVYQFVKA